MSGNTGFVCYYHLFDWISKSVPPGKAHDNSAYAALIAVQFLFGTFPVIGKSVLAIIPSVALVGFRVGIAAAILASVQRFRGPIRLAERGDYAKLAILSLFGVTINQLLFVKGLSLTKAANTSLLAVTIPIFAITVSAILGVEKLHRKKAVGVGLAALGVVLLVDPRNASFSSETTLGDLLIILNSLSFGIYVAASKSVVTRNGAMRSIVWIFVFAAMICVPLGAFSLSSVDTSAVEPHIWAAVLHISIIATALPYFLNAWALARVDPSTVAVFIYLQPVIGFMMAVYFLGERVGTNFALAALLIFAGVWLVTRAPRGKT
jgi:drug/metabolite transporter (DMT)-like permease